MQAPATPTSQSVVLRRAEARDVSAAGKICYHAFAHVSDKHGAPHDLPSEEVGEMLMGMLINNPGFYCVVAEQGGRVVGSNCLDERNAISGVGPITIDPKVQDSGIGRQLMDAVIRRSDERNFPGVRLVQAGYHMRSLSLYTKLGFTSVAQLVVMNGVPALEATSDVRRHTVRPATAADVPACNALCFATHGFHRGGELEQAIAHGAAQVAERDGAIRAYTSGLGYFGHTVGESNHAIAALLAQAPHMPSLGVLLPTANYQLFRWCLDHGMRALMTMTLMSRGIYQEPAGPYLPSISY